MVDLPISPQKLQVLRVAQVDRHYDVADDLRAAGVAMGPSRAAHAAHAGVADARGACLAHRALRAAPGDPAVGLDL